MSDEPFYAPSHTPAPPPEPLRGERLFEFEYNRRRMICELFDHGEYGIEARFSLVGGDVGTAGGPAGQHLPPRVADRVPGCGRPWAHPARLQTDGGPEPRTRGRPAFGGDGDGGHKTESIYRRYAIVDAGVLRDAAAKIDLGAGTSSNVTGTISGTMTADRGPADVAKTA